MFRKTSPICQCHLHSWKKVLASPISVLAHMILAWTVKSKKILKKHWGQTLTNVLSACQVSYGNDIRGSHGKKTKINGPKFIFLPRLPRMSFPNETCQALRTFVVLCHHIFFDLFWIFLEFTIHGGIKRAKTRMCTFQHFFHECKWHWHIGDVFSEHFVILFAFFWFCMN